MQILDGKYHIHDVLQHYESIHVASNFASLQKIFRKYHIHLAFLHYEQMLCVFSILLHFRIQIYIGRKQISFLLDAWVQYDPEGYIVFEMFPIIS